ncbi:hypothetical protein COCOR_04089 [Corallococcus coralloides DSM 2259]|uniref:Outer membrane protein beta-barrel domain-containing protein n=1 Tax=Corallococcus coralloides (strain ATCC 25202 / DSM 2259 / NBRC 100086 / M2) TaxID=1144275 RepID=H8MX82_CORCM|nr:TonB-dependent receptor [Corallococcus coralloides]AFE05623.1 hypothetical protein COCOR_04089 [Corallococcus coralloides DSM 2259]
MMRSRPVSIALLGAALLLAPAAYAAPKKASAKTAQSSKKKSQPAEARRVAVLASGPHAEAARDALEAELARRPARYEIVPESAVRAAASRLGRDPTQPAGAAAVASELGLSAVLVADTSTVGKKHQVRVTVRNGKDGKALASPAAAKPATPKLVPVAVKRQWTALERGLQKSSAPVAAPVAPPQPPTPVEPEPAVKPATPIAETPAPTTTPAAEPIRKPVAAAPKETKETKAPEKEEDSLSTEAEQASAPIVEGALGVKLFGRSLRYKDDVFGVLRPYTLGPDVGGFALPGAPQVAGDVTVYPLAAFQKGALARLGITGAIDQSFGLKSTGSTGAVSYPTTAREWQAGLRYVIPFGEAQRHGFEITGTYGMNTFRIDAVDGERPLDLPNVEYKTAGLGLGVRAALSEKFDFNFRLGYQHPLDSGELSSDAWFPRMSAGAVTGSATLAYRLNRILDVRVKADLRRYFFKFNPEPGDPYVAGGAVDQYPGLSFQLGFRY